ncbi:MarR family winged helix-turn-helix transcriptional regulator [Phenylobacterium sp.]|uniref:MarR family winged helix-turn-helix transcriptional regulator n=1 Tax=Phenylobacterium sp. TaxID=1871053 RepID=UPI0035B46DD1
MTSAPHAHRDAPPARVRRRRLTAADYQALGAFRYALRRFLAFSEAGAKALDLTPQQHQALLAIRAHTGPDPMSIGDLAECLLIKNHSAVGLVARLVDRGLVVRRASAEDRRRILLHLTPAAEGKLETISRNNLGELNRASDIFRELLGTLRQLHADGVWTDPAPSASDE